MGDFGVYGAALSDLNNRTQDVVSEFHQTTVQDSTSWNSASTQLWDDLRAGVPFPVALLEFFLNSIFGVGNIFSSMLEVGNGSADQFNEKWFGIDSAQTSADYANAQLAVFNRLIVDTFDRAAGGVGADWDVFAFGSGGGGPQLDGAGKVYWLPFSGLPRSQFFRWNPTTTTTDIQVVSAVQATVVQTPSSGTEAYNYMFARINDASTPSTGAYARIGYDSVALGCFVGGVETTFTTAALSMNSGDTWDFWAGTAISDYEFVLIRNGLPVLSFTDTFHVSQKGAGFRSVGWGMHAADRFGFFGQTVPGKLVVFSADDRTP